MDRRILKTKKSLYDALLHLMGECSFEEIKVSEICEKAMTNRSTFYAHFEDKYALLSSLLLDLKNSLKQELEKNNQITNSKDFYMECIRLLFLHIEENRSIYSPLLKNNKNSIAMDMIYSAIIEDITDRMSLEKRTEQTLIPTEFIADFYVGAIFQVGMKWIQLRNYYSKDEIIDYLDQLIPEQLI